MTWSLGADFHVDIVGGAVCGVVCHVYFDFVIFFFVGDVVYGADCHVCFDCEIFFFVGDVALGVDCHVYFDCAVYLDCEIFLLLRGGCGAGG